MVFRVQRNCYLFLFLVEEYRKGLELSFSIVFRRVIFVKGVLFYFYLEFYFDQVGFLGSFLEQGCGNVGRLVFFRVFMQGIVYERSFWNFLVFKGFR